MEKVRRIRPILFLAMVALLLASLSQVMFAKITTAAQPEVRVTKKVDNSKRTTLYGHVSAAVRTAQDMGRQDPRTPSPGMIMVLKSSEDQKREIRKVIDEQQDKRTANYHQWVTPEEFGEHFGVHDDDLAQIKTWLTSQGFTVDEVSKSKRVIKFSGNIGQVEQAFQTEMHTYNLHGEMHVANNTEISVPEAFNKVIAGVTLHNFYRKGSFDRKKMIKFGPKFNPHYTSSSSVHYVAPSDFATIYNTQPLLNQGITGTGETIAIVGRSDILLSDVQSYRQLFNLPPNDPMFIHAGQDNGVEPGDDGESDLDVEISGGMAPGAHVDFVIGTPTFLVDGITNSVEYIVENNLADIMSISYGDCELNEGTGGNEFNNQAFEQAAAQGITTFIAAGDNGPAGCDDQNDSYEVLGYAAPAEGSTPYVTTAGGTELSGECPTLGANCSQSNYAKYWGPSTNGYYLSSALEYIPETPWNVGKGSNVNAAPSSDLSGLWSGSGAVSAYYLRPSWQQGGNSPTLVSQTDPSMYAYTAGSGGSVTTDNPGYWVASVNITNPGSGYTAGPTITWSGGTCATLPATTLASTISGGSVTAVNFNYGTQGGTLAAGQGINCTVAPTVTFTAAPAGGTTATGTAVLGPMTMQPALVSGVPHRLTPDLSLNADDAHDATLYCSEGVCEFTTSNGQNTITDAGLVGGTSVAAPSAAGIQALINQYQARNYPEPGNPTGRQGVANYVYYGLAAAQNNATCAASALVPPNDANQTACAFQDIQVGNTYICGTSTCTSSSGTKIGWPAGVGYDLATGLGSVNAYNVATQWNTVVFNSTTTTLALSQTTFAHGTPITLSGTVSGTNTPTGDVAFIVSQGEIGIPISQATGAFVGPGAFATLSGGNYSGSVSALPAGTYNVTARYGGDGTNASSLSAPVQVTVTPEPVTITIQPQLITQTTTCQLSNSNGPFTYGQLIWAQISVAGVSGQGIPTGSVTITDSINGGPTNTVTTIPLDPNGNGYLVSGAISTSSCLFDYIFAQVPTLIGGTHSISATYSGDSTFNAGSAGTPASIVVTPITTTPTLAATATFIPANTPVQFTATFAANSAVTSSKNTGSSGPTGTVTFYDTISSTNLGTASLVPTVTYTGPGSTGYPSYTYAATAILPGVTSITASVNVEAIYSGDSNYTAETSTAVPITIEASQTANTVVLTASANPTTLRGEPTFTATNSAANAGTVTFYDATYGVVLGSATVGTAKTGTLKLGASPAFVGGAHNIVAYYGGTATFAPATSATLVENVTKGSGAVSLSGKQADISGNTYTLAAVFTPSATYTAYNPVQGVVTFSDAVNGGSSAPIGTAPLNIVGAEQGGYGLWAAPLSATLITPGTHVITAQYVDVNYTSSVSNSLTVYVTNTGSATGIYAPLPGSTLPTTGTIAFKWFPDGQSVGGSYWLDIGPTQGSNNYYQSGNMGSVLAQTVNAGLIPANGSTVWARLWYLVNGSWSYVDASYNSVGTGTPAAMTSPTSGSGLCSTSQTFTWSAGSPAYAYWIDVGSTPGGNQYYQSGSLSTSTLSATVNGLPVGGGPIYVTLYTETNNSPATWVNHSYSYYATNLDNITSPANGDPDLSGTQATFNWTNTNPSCGDTYWIDISAVAPGGNDVWQSGNLGNVFSASNPPSNPLPDTNPGTTIFVTLYTINGGNVLGNTQTTYVSGP